MRIYNYAIKLIDNWQLVYSSIYNIGLIELETLKTYIKNNLVNGFIRPFTSLIKTFIFFDMKPNKNFKLGMDY